MLIFALNYHDDEYDYFEDYNLNNLGDTPEDAIRQLLTCYKYDNRLSEMVEAKDTRGNTPLCHAATVGKAEMVTLLLEANAALETKCKRGSTALWNAVYVNELSVVKVFLDAGASTSVTDDSGRDLKYAADYNKRFDPKRPEVLQYLLANGHVTQNR